MALLDAYRSALSSVAGQPSGLSGLSAGLSTAVGALETAAERRRKKQEEERAREREGLTFSLNQAIKAGDKAAIKRLGPQVYGPDVDFGAVADAAAKETERAQFKEDLALLPNLSGEEQARLGQALGIRLAEMRGETPYLPPQAIGPAGDYTKAARPSKTVPRKSGGILPHALDSRMVGGELFVSPRPFNEEEYARYLADVAELNPQAFQELAQRGLAARPVLERGDKLRAAFQPLPRGTEGAEKQQAAAPIDLRRPEGELRYRLGESADTKAKRDVRNNIDKEAQRLRSRIDTAYEAIADEDKPKFLEAKAGLEEAVDNWRAGAIANNGATDSAFPKPTVAFAGATTYKGQQVRIQERKATARESYQNARIAQISRGLDLSEKRIGVYAQSVANNYTLGKQRNVIAADNAAVRRDHLTAFIESKNIEQSLKDWAATADAQAKIDRLILDSRKAAVDTVRKTPAFSDTARKEAVAAGQGDAFDNDYKNAVAAEEGRLVQSGLMRLAPKPPRREINKPESTAVKVEVVDPKTGQKATVERNRVPAAGGVKPGAKPSLSQRSGARPQ